jgi:hypothetical protein
MSIVRRNKNGFGCDHIDDDVVAHVPADAKTPVPRPPDLDLYTRALRDEWDLSPEVKADTVARLHAITKYVNDPRAVNKAADVLVKMTESNHRGREVALRVAQTHPATSSSSAARKYDLEAFKEPEPDRPEQIRKRAIEAATRAWDDAKALGWSEQQCDFAGVSLWTATWEQAGYPAPPAPWIMEDLADDRDPE